jgi:hypothetical protein
MRNQTGAVSAETPYLRGDRVPSITMTANPGGERFELRPSRGPRVFVSLHSSDCEECIDYARKIAAVRESVEAWGADLVIVSGDASLSTNSLPAPFDLTVIEDPDRVICRGRLEVIVVDEWGEVHFASDGNGAHNPLLPAEVVEWAKFVAIQCPECEGPEGAWKDL